MQSPDKEKIILDGQVYDAVINCTYNQALQYHSARHRHYFDLCFSLVVASRATKARCKAMSFGVFDGAYPSLEPYGFAELPRQYQAYRDRQIFQIFHVKHTSVQQYTDISTARRAEYVGLSSQQLLTLTDKILSDMRNFYPQFDHEFEIIGHDLALKTKVHDLSDARPLMVLKDVEKHPMLIQVFSSKLTSIFSAEEQVKQLINQAKKDIY